MLIKNFHIRINIPTNDKITVDYKYKFKKKSRHITYYLVLNCLNKNKFESNKFDTIIISLQLDKSKTPVVTKNKSLDIPLFFDNSYYDSIKNVMDFRLYVEECIKTALSGIADLYEEVPTRDLLITLQELKNKNYKNEWLYKKKIDRKDKLLVELNCQLTIDVFKLFLNIHKGNDIIFNEIVLETDPDDVAFNYRFKDIVFKENKVIITSKTSTNLLEFSLNNYKISYK